MAGQVDPGGIGDVHTSLPTEASNRLEARNPSAGRPERTNQGALTETSGLELPTAGTIFEERNLIQEDFWSLLRDAGYEEW